MSGAEERNRNSESSYHRKGLMLTAIGATLFTFDVPLARLAMTDPWTMIFVRGVFLALGLMVLTRIMWKIDGYRGPFINGWAGIVVVITNTLANIMFLSAVTMTTAANLVFILALNPVFCLILGWIFVSEHIHLWTWVAIGGALLGVGVIVWAGLDIGTSVGDLLAVGVALCTATALIVIRKSGKNVTSSLAIGSLVSACLALFVGAQPANLAPEGWGWLALNALLVMPLASGLIAQGPRYLPAPEVALFFLLELALVPIWVWLIFDEVPSTGTLIGGAIIFASLFVHALWRWPGIKQVFAEAP